MAKARLMAFLAALLLGLLAPTTAAQEAVSVTIPEQVMIVGDRIWLGEIAQIAGPEADVASLQRRLDHVSLGPSPRPGASRTLTRGTVETRLRSALGSPEGFTASVPERVEISRAATWVPEAQLRGSIEAWIGQSLGLPSAQVSVEELGLRGPIPIPLGPYELQFSGTGAPPVGDTAIVVSVWQVGAEVSKQRISCRVRVVAPVVVASRGISRGDALKANDLDLVSRSLDDLTAPVFGAVGALLGMQTRRAIPAGTILTEADVALPSDIEQGDLITVWVRSSALTISAQGEARGSGRAGDTIPVWCEPTGKILKAVIVGPGEVEVRYHATGL